MKLNRYGGDEGYGHQLMDRMAEEGLLLGIGSDRYALKPKAREIDNALMAARRRAGWRGAMYLPCRTLTSVSN